MFKANKIYGNIFIKAEVLKLEYCNASTWALLPITLKGQGRGKHTQYCTAVRRRKQGLSITYTIKQQCHRHREPCRCLYSTPQHMENEKKKMIETYLCFVIAKVELGGDYYYSLYIGESRGSICRAPHTLRTLLLHCVSKGKPLAPRASCCCIPPSPAKTNLRNFTPRAFENLCTKALGQSELRLRLWCFYTYYSKYLWLSSPVISISDPMAIVKDIAFIVYLSCKMNVCNST